MIIIHNIRVTWTKKSRGAPGSTRRNAVPRSVLIDLEECTFLFERYIFYERDSFKQNRDIHLAQDLIPYKVGNLLLKHQNDELNIGFNSEYSIGDLFNIRKLVKEYRNGKLDFEKIREVDKLDWGGGSPNRDDIGSAFQLRTGMYARLLINGRHTTRESINWYSQDIYNIAVVGQPTPDLFLSREPDRVIDLRVHLF